MTTITTTAPISPLRQRMLHDMMMRGLSRHKQQDYIRHVRRFAAFLKRPPDTEAPEILKHCGVSNGRSVSLIAAVHS